MNPRGLAFLWLACSCASGREAAPADTLYVNGAVLTLDARSSVASAVAVRQGKIVAVGSDADLRAFRGPSTRVVDLQGRTLAPGFYAPHDHLPGAGHVALYQADLNSPPLGTIRDMADLVEALRAKAEKTPKGRWIVGRGYDDTLLREQRHPTRLDLDRVSTDHPIWIAHISGHLGVANSRALEIAGVTRDTPSPEGGVIRKDPATGEPTGVFEECGSLVTRHLPPRTDEETLRAIEWCVDEYARKGVTTTVIAGGSRASIAALKRAHEQGTLRLRTVTMTSGENREARLLLKEVEPARLRAGAVKLFADGSIQGYTGHLTRPYHRPPGDDPSYRGYPTRSRESLTRTVVALHQAGRQVAVHGNGDAAIDAILHAFGEAQRVSPRQDARHRIEHAQMARDDQLDAMKALGITPSFFVGHVFYWGDRHRERFLGPERARRISPLRSALDRGLRFTLHEDTPVTPVNPLFSVWVASNRVTRQGLVLGEDQRVSVEAALRAVTIDAAWQNFEEATKGSIEPGKLADFVVLDRNPLGVDPAELRRVAVLETIVGGRTIYRRE
jgi:hypothetical protein